MQQIYDLWLTDFTKAQNRQPDGAMLNQPVPEEKSIIMPTDYAEQMVGLHLFSRSAKSRSKKAS